MTFVDDVVDATVLAGRAELEPGIVLNVAGGSEVSLAELIDRVEASHRIDDRHRPAPGPGR